MKPLFLSIKGINSFIERQEVDFKNLTDNNIFCIFGPTGSGKTTILDSIILALYGRGERGILEEYINLAENSAEIIFEFEFDKTVYKVTRILKRKTGQSAEFYCDSVLKAKGTDKVNAEIEDLIGLKSNEFTQVVILQQGKFSKFLNATKTERGRTISQLFSLGKFEGLSTRFNELAKKYDTDKKIKESEIAHLSYITCELIENNKSILKEKNGLLEEISKSLRDIEKKLIEDSAKSVNYKTLLTSKESLSAAEAALNALNKDIEQLIIKEQNKTDMEKLQAESKIIEKEADKILTKIESIRKEKTEIDKLIITKNELLDEFKNIDEKLKKENKKIENETKKMAEIINEINSKSLKSDFYKIINSVSLNDFNADKTARQLNEYLAVIIKDEADFTNLNQSITAKINKTESDSKRIIETEWILKNSYGSLEKLEANAKDLKIKLDEKIRNNMAEKIADGLKSGDKCPVCGGTFVQCDKKTHLETAGSENEFRQITEEIRQLNDKIIAGKTTLDKLNIDREADKAQIKNESGIIKNILEKYNNPESGRFFTDEKKCVNEILDLIHKYKISDGESKKLERIADSLQCEKQGILDKGKNLKEEIDRFYNKVKNEVGENYDEIAKVHEDKKSAAIKIISDYEKLTQEILSEKQKIDKEKTALENDIKRNREIIERLNGITFNETDNEKNKIEKERLSHEKQALAVEIASLNENIKIQSEGLEKKNLVNNEIGSIIKKYDTANLLASMFKANKFLDFIEREYIDEFTFNASEMLNKLSDGRYSLKYIEENGKSDFWVTDFMQGNESRKIGTLSGGETFLTSVSMAIAISGQISKEKNFDFFFLDEGFGTLDENAICTVTDALYNLSKTTLVGVVSHRTEIVERIASKIEVIKATETEGSKITIKS